MFVGSSYEQHANAEHLSHPNLRYHGYFFPKHIKLPDVNECSNGSSFATKKYLNYIQMTRFLVLVKIFRIFREPYEKCGSVELKCCSDHLERFQDVIKTISRVMKTARTAVKV